MTRATKPRGAARAVVLIGIAILVALVPFPAAAVERYYSLGLYPAIQRVLTPASDLVPIALLDLGVLAVLGFLVIRFRAARWRGLGLALLKTVAVVYLVFMVLWGLNYRRVPLEEKLDFDRARVTRERAAALAAESVARLNALHAGAHVLADGDGVSRLSVELSFNKAWRALGGTVLPRTGRPKHSLFGFYFRYAAIDGMTNPVFLEVILNPDLLPVEQPEVLAHEWAHLGGYADESEANFVAWLTCLRGDPLAQYSGWLSAYSRSTAVLPRDLRATLPPLADGPRKDIETIVARYRRSSPVVRKVARETYDSYLKANRIEEGIANYDAVLQLMLGTTLGSQWTPR